MQDVRSRSRKERTRSVRCKTGTGIRSNQQGDPAAPPPANPPFLLAPPAFPLDVRVPPHRGAVIAPARGEDPSGYVISIPARPAQPAGDEAAAPTRKRAANKSASRTKRTAKAPRTAKVPKTAKAPGRKSAGAAKPRAIARAAAAPRTMAPAPIAPEPMILAPAASPAPLPAAPDVRPPESRLPVIPLCETALPEARLPDPAGSVAAGPGTVPAEAPLFPPRPAALPRSRALVRTDGGVIGRLVAWLGRLMPRQRRAPLPRAPGRLVRPVPPTPTAPHPTAPHQTAPHQAADRPAPAPEAPEAANDLTQRMLLQLSAENERLRRELAALRGGGART